jgi:hypothetical protein
MRKLRCTKCGKEWEEPVRPGARPWTCPSCNPAAAQRRKAERDRAAHQGFAQAEEAIRPKEARKMVPAYLISAVAGAVNAAARKDITGKEDLGLAVRDIAKAKGAEETRAAIRRAAGVLLAWDASIPEDGALKRKDTAA